MHYVHKIGTRLRISENKMLYVINRIYNIPKKVTANRKTKEISDFVRTNSLTDIKTYTLRQNYTLSSMSLSTS